MKKPHQESDERIVVSPRMLKAGAAVLANRGNLDDYATVAAIYRSMLSEAARNDARRAQLPSHAISPQRQTTR